MSLLDLPPEIIDIIIDATRPDGIESFVLSCKAIYGRAAAQIAQHNDLKRKWSHTTNAAWPRRGDTLHVLYEISREPIIASYINSLALWDRRTEDDVYHEPHTSSFRDDDEASKRMKNLLANSGLFTRDDAEYWWKQIMQEDMEGDEESADNLYAAVALLALLPNLKTFQPPDRWHEVRRTEAAEALAPVVESLVSISNSDGPSTQPLANLETIFPFVEEGYDVRVGLQCLQPFMCLRSIRNLYAVSCVALDGHWRETSLQWPNPKFKSPLTRIELASCCIDSGGLAVLLQNTPALTIFRYSHQTKWDDPLIDWNAGEFLETLAQYCGDGLIDLAITVDELHGEIVNGASSFMRFTRLERLEVDVLPFCGPPLESGQRLGRNARVPDGAKPWTHTDIPCLGSMLPDSMRELHVNTDHPAPTELTLLALFSNMKGLRESKLNELDKIIIRQYCSRSAEHLAREFHISFEVFDEGQSNPRPRSMMPSWKREFDALVGGIVAGGSS